MASFSASYAGIGAMLRSPEMRAEMLRRATRAKSYATAIAPRDTGAFASSLRVQVEERGGARNDRACATVYSTDPAGLSIELGTAHTPAHRTLRKSLDAMRD